MHVKHREWLELYTVVIMQRLRARNELTRQMIARSYEQIDESRQLLWAEVPRTWYRPP